MGSMEAETPTQARTWIEHSDTCIYIYICMYIYTVTVHMYSWDFGTCTLHTKSWLSVPCCHGANGENMQDADAAAGAAVATVEIAARKDNLS